MAILADGKRRQLAACKKPVVGTDPVCRFFYVVEDKFIKFLVAANYFTAAAN